MEKLNALEVSKILIDLIESANDTDFLEDSFQMEASTFEDAGILTIDNGLVLKINGREFQVTIIRSK